MDITMNRTMNMINSNVNYNFQTLYWRIECVSNIILITCMVIGILIYWDIDYTNKMIKDA
jgi:hypothetical protein